MNFATVEDLYQEIRRRLSVPGYADAYVDESAFEDAVWSRLADEPGLDRAQHCLTSHTKRSGRSADAWEAFCGGSATPPARC